MTNAPNGGLSGRSVDELLDRLIAFWSFWDRHELYYLTVLAPRIAGAEHFEFLAANEGPIVEALKRGLPPSEFARLPTLIASRRVAVASRKAQLQAEAVARETATANREKEADAREKRRRRLLDRFQMTLRSDFLSAERLFASAENDGLLPRDEFQQLQAAFVREWVERELGTDFDADQAAAIASTKDDVLVVARAGSGKTRTIVNRAIFLQKHCRVSPRQMLLLAFNADAAEEMKSRLAEAPGGDMPHVMTFHALAYALVHPDEDLVYDDASSNQLGRSREIQEVIDEHLRSPEHQDRIRELMLAYFRDDWERIARGGFELTMDELLAYRRSLPRETLNGEFVKSFGERVIANALFEHGIPYRYERNVRWNGLNYRPDFTILEPRLVVIEYFGLEGDPDYDLMSEKKRGFWATKDDVVFLEFSPSDLLQQGVDGFIENLLIRLADAGITGALLSEEKIWGLVKRRALDGFTAVMGTFVGRCRKGNLGAEELHQLVADHTPATMAERLFLSVGTSIYLSYLERMERTGKEDFDGLMWRAVDAVRRGQTKFARDKGQERGDLADLRYVMVDEYQDFSQMFHELLEAARATNELIQLFCVGDDWQAINAFAGSELRFFNDFTAQRSGASRRYLPTNYRSARAIVEVGNALMFGDGVAARAHRAEVGEVCLAELDKFRPSVTEAARHDGDEITPAVLRMVSSFLRRGLKVVLLSRTHRVPWYVLDLSSGHRPSGGLEGFLEGVRSFLPEDERALVIASTSHGYKGLEQQAVIVLDAVERRYPLIHPHWVFLRLFGDNIAEIWEEERRLFYVALTRAQESLVMISESSRPSPFISDIEAHLPLARLDWTQLTPAPSLDGTGLEIRIFGAFDVRDQLKALNYRWNGRFWGRIVPADGFAFGAILQQPWVNSVTRIEVLDPQTGDARFTHPDRSESRESR